MIFKKKEKISQEFLFVKCLKTDTKDKTIFKEFDQFFYAKNTPLGNILSEAIGGAKGMVDRRRGFLAYLELAIWDILRVHLWHFLTAFSCQKS